MPLPSQARSLLRPLGRFRSAIEWMRYRGVDILGPQATNDLLARTLTSTVAHAIGKVGATELAAVQHYLRQRDGAGLCRDWGRHQVTLFRNAGVFPADPLVLSRFCQCYIDTLSGIDILAVWFRWGERMVTRRYASAARYVTLMGLEPYYHERPWSAALAGKHVLVVTPFGETLRRQYAHRCAVWTARPEVLPEFTLDILQVPLSAALVSPTFPDWFTALEYFQRDMAQRRFDVAIIGAGAWSLPLALHAKGLGKWAIHLGGPTQVLFGIRGRRWDGNPPLQRFYNAAWTRPAEQESPPKSSLIENGCYW